MIDSLSPTEEALIKRYLLACASLLDYETFTFVGVTNQELKEIAQNWPQNKKSANTILVVNNCLNLLVNGFNFDNKTWNSLGIQASRKEISCIFDVLLRTKNLPPLRNKNDLFDYINQGNTPKYIFFRGAKGNLDSNCLSQFYPVHFAIDNRVFCSAEQYYMSEKARFFNDQEKLQEILKSKSPLEAKKLGRKVKNFNEVQWMKVCFEVVVKGNTAKFSQNNKLKGYLESTKGKVLVEASPHDCIWGIGLGQDDSESQDPHKWRGENLLGFALMKVRDEIL